MLVVKPDLNAYSADRTAVRSPLGKSPTGLSSAPTSPKTQELRARYEAIQATANALQLTKSDTGAGK